MFDYILQLLIFTANKYINRMFIDSIVQELRKREKYFCTLTKKNKCFWLKFLVTQSFKFFIIILFL